MPPLCPREQRPDHLAVGCPWLYLRTRGGCSLRGAKQVHYPSAPFTKAGAFFSVNSGCPAVLPRTLEDGYSVAEVGPKGKSVFGLLLVVSKGTKSDAVMQTPGTVLEGDDATSRVARENG